MQELQWIASRILHTGWIYAILVDMIPSHFWQQYIRHACSVCLMLLALTGLTACSMTGQADELRSYRTQMETFFSELELADTAIASIDASMDTAEDDLLTQVDSIAVSCAAIADVEPPSGYEQVQDKAEHAAAMMGQASSGFHDAFESDSLDQDAYDAAMEYYRSAGNDIQEMIRMLQSGSDTN